MLLITIYIIYFVIDSTLIIIVVVTSVFVLRAPVFLSEIVVKLSDLLNVSGTSPSKDPLHRCEKDLLLGVTLLDIEFSQISDFFLWLVIDDIIFLERVKHDHILQSISLNHMESCM